MDCIDFLPPETNRNFIEWVRKALEDHPNPEADANLQQAKRLAEEIEADAKRRKRELEAEMRRQSRANQRKLEAAQRSENARVAQRKPGDFGSVGLTGFDD